LRRLGKGGAPANGDAHVTGELPDIAFETSLLRWRKRASWGTQFRILGGRAFNNPYNDPALLAAHHLSAVGFAGRFFAFSLTIVCLSGFWTVIHGLVLHDVTYVLEPLHRLCADCFLGMILRDSRTDFVRLLLCFMVRSADALWQVSSSSRWPLWLSFEFGTVRE